MLYLGLVFASCSNYSASGSDASSTEKEELTMPPGMYVDEFIAKMYDVYSLAMNGESRKAENTFNQACKPFLKALNSMNEEQLDDAYICWGNATRNEGVRQLFVVDTPLARKLGEFIEKMRIAHDERIMSLFGKTLEFTDKAGNRFTIQLTDNDDRPCTLYSEAEGRSMSGTWKYSSRDLGASALKVSIPDARSGSDENWEYEKRGVDFADAHDYHNTYHRYMPTSSSGDFYIIKNQIWPYFISSDGYDGYRSYALPYTVKAD